MSKIIRESPCDDENCAGQPSTITLADLQARSPHWIIWHAETNWVAIPRTPATVAELRAGCALLVTADDLPALAEKIDTQQALMAATE